MSSLQQVLAWSSCHELHGSRGLGNDIRKTDHAAVHKKRDQHTLKRSLIKMREELICVSYGMYIKLGALPREINVDTKSRSLKCSIDMVFTDASVKKVMRFKRHITYIHKTFHCRSVFCYFEPVLYTFEAKSSTFILYKAGISVLSLSPYIYDEPFVMTLISPKYILGRRSSRLLQRCAPSNISRSTSWASSVMNEC